MTARAWSALIIPYLSVTHGERATSCQAVARHQECLESDGAFTLRRHDAMGIVGTVTCRGSEEDANGVAKPKTNQDYACVSRRFAQVVLPNMENGVRQNVLR